MPLVPPQYIPLGAAKVKQAQQLFTDIIANFAGENIIAQITAAGKTKLISDVCKDVLYYGSQGSLFEAYVAVEKIIITDEMHPFLTENRRQEFKNALVEALSKL